MRLFRAWRRAHPISQFFHIKRDASSVPDAGTESGFALLEVIVALVIMALVGLMAWRGMDAMIRGGEVIDRRANQDADYSQLVRQFEKDCQSVLVRDELSGLANSQAGGGVSSSVGGGAVSAVAYGAKNIWFLRRYRADNVDAWIIAGYGMGPNGLQRWTSKPLLQRSDAGALWFGISRDPDLASSDLLLSLEVPTVVRQAFQVKTSIVSGAGGVGTSASGTGSPTTPAINVSANTASTSATTNSTTNPSTNAAPNVSNLLPEQQGVVMHWWIKDVALPITRSCLMGGAL